MNKPTLTQAINAAIEYALKQIHVCLPGRIEEYDFTEQKASVTPLLSIAYDDGTTVDMPIVQNVPVVFPAGGGASITFPLRQGDGVLLVFSERSIDQWLSLGGVVVPDDPRTFDLSDAIAIPGLNPFRGNGLAQDNDSVYITYNDATIKIGDDGTVDINDGNLTVET